MTERKQTVIWIDSLMFPNDSQDIKKYLKTYDPEAHEGMGLIEFTGDVHEAMKFVSAVEALRCLRQVPNNRPIRSDGKPNRPLTAYTVQILAVDFPPKEKR